MNAISGLLRDADPLRDEPPCTTEERARVERAVLDVALVRRNRRAPAWTRARVLAIAAALAMLGGVVVAVWSRGSTTVQAAVQFEVRPASAAFSPGLIPARVAGSGDLVYLGQQTIVTNDDIADLDVVPSDTPSRFSIVVTFTAKGAEKMRRATTHPASEFLALIVDGGVVAAPRIRGAISESAVITGDYTRSEADRLAAGMRLR